MAGPVYIGVGGATSSAGAATITATLLAGVTSGQLHLAACASKNNAVHSTATSGWTKIGQVNSGANLTVSWWVANGGVAAPVFTWTGSVQCYAAAFAYASPDGAVSTGTPSTNAGLTSAHSTTGVTTTQNNSLVVYLDISGVSLGLATPAGWTERGDGTTGSFTGQITWGDQAIATAGTGSGNISVTGANGAWVQIQVELLNTPVPANTFQVSKEEALAWADAKDGFDVSLIETLAWVEPPLGLTLLKAETGAWLEPPDGFSISKTEVGAWIDAVVAAARRRNACVMINHSNAIAPPVNSSFVFNGTTGVIEKGSAVVLAYPFTLVAWIKPDVSLGSTSAFAVGGVSTATTARLDLVDNSSGAGVNKIDAFAVNAGSTGQSATGPTNWTADTWQHVAGVWSSSSNRIAYLNGVAGTANTNANTTDLTTYIRSLFGARYNAGARSNFFRGKMAHMAMYNVALTGAEIAALATPGTLPTSVQGGNIVMLPIWSGALVIDQIGGATLTSTGVTGDTDMPF